MHSPHKPLSQKQVRTPLNRNLSTPFLLPDQSRHQWSLPSCPSICHIRTASSQTRVGSSGLFLPVCALVSTSPIWTRTFIAMGSACTLGTQQPQLSALPGHSPFGLFASYLI